MGVVILEGAPGTGKTNIADELMYQTGIKTRSFNLNPEIELNENRVKVLSDIEKLVECGERYILIKSAPTLIAISLLNPTGGNLNELFYRWQKRVKKIPGESIYVWLSCDYEVAKERHGKGFIPKKEYLKIERNHERIFQKIRMNKMRIHTDQFTVLRSVEKIYLSWVPYGNR